MAWRWRAWPRSLDEARWRFAHVDFERSEESLSAAAVSSALEAEMAGIRKYEYPFLVLAYAFYATAADGHPSRDRSDFFELGPNALLFVVAFVLFAHEAFREWQYRQRYELILKHFERRAADSEKRYD